MSKSTGPIGQFPHIRLRRNRQSTWSRNIVRENSIQVNDLIWPIFIRDGSLDATVDTFPGVKRVTVDEVVSHVKEAVDLGIQAVMLFPVIPFETRTEDGAEAFNAHSIVCQAIKKLKTAYPDLGVICDVALDPYTSHGHDGLLVDGDVANDQTVDMLVKQSVTLAEAGVDAVSPSDMMDGRIAAIRTALDQRGFEKVQIISYAAKYASSFYGPFRDAVGSKSTLGKKGKQSYQMDPANGDEALREVAHDIQEGADMLIIKPGIAYLDIVHRVKEKFQAPTLAYQVSGEYAMIKAAASQGMVDEAKVLMETLTSFKRAGCDAIITYGALEAARLLQGVAYEPAISTKQVG